MSADQLVVNLTDTTGVDRQQLGGKAATLAALTIAGFPVPAGFVVTAGAFDHVADLEAAVTAAAEPLGAGPFAVRSSAAAEDLADASYAGLYETFLDVPREGLAEAVRRCHASATAPRVASYQAGRGGGTRPGMAVLVQRMVRAEAAGVAFTANPVTGDRDQTVVTAVRGLGERLVGGEAVGQEWVVRADEVDCRRAADRVIDAGQARAVADLARQVECHAGDPQDIEWAFTGGRLFLLQARPMTALPDPVDWTPPGPGVWLRSFRLGEWLHEPMTPLFADWLLPRMADGFADAIRATTGAVLDFPHAAVKGWYYATPHPVISPWRLTRAVVASRGRLLWFVYHALFQATLRPHAADRALLADLYQRWRRELLPEYRRLVALGETEVDTPSERLIAIVDQVGRLTGAYLWYLAIVGGSAWKMEARLARFVRRHLRQTLPDGVTVLLRGLPGTETEPPPYAVSSIDWYHPTLGELPTAAAGGDPLERQHRADRLTADRRDAEAACRTALAHRPRLLARFTTLLQVAQRYAVIREEQARHLTLGWPLLRRAAQRLGHILRASEVIDDPADIFFLTRAELHPRGRSLADEIIARRTTWRRQRQLAAPLVLGHAPRLVEVVMAKAGATGPTPAAAPDGAVVGQPASPGRVTGPVRVLHGPNDFDRFQSGEILVAPATAPAWTPLFGRAIAVVTDGGTLAAHASLIAREYGIPAVVGTGDATGRLHDGQIVTVDGATGVVAPAPAAPELG